MSIAIYAVYTITCHGSAVGSYSLHIIILYILYAGKWVIPQPPKTVLIVLIT